MAFFVVTLLLSAFEHLHYLFGLFPIHLLEHFWPALALYDGCGVGRLNAPTRAELVTPLANLSIHPMLLASRLSIRLTAGHRMLCFSNSVQGALN